MAKKISGITIEVGGDTTKLQKSLNQLQAPINKINQELSNVNKALKLDPKNTELLAQKQDILGRNIQATREKLQKLNEAQAKMGDYAKLTDEQKAVFNRLSLEIAKSENALKKMNDELKTTSKIDLSKVQSSLKKVGEVALDVSKKLLQVSTAIGGALASVVGLGVKSYASLEQNLGAIDKLFGESADELISKSKEAYKTAGISANQYMETATSFSASLLKGLSGDTELAVQLTDRAIRDMSDNANTFGSSMDEVMNVYKALSKEQYTTLDNLRLGYAGTKTGMQELIKDASTYTDIQKELGITVDASSMSFDNIINAISVMQKHLNITGTTMKEAEGTITGSINSMKASFDNFLNGSGSPESLSESIMNVLNNISGSIQKLAPNILKGLIDLIKNLIPQIGKLLFQTIPELLDAISSMVDELLSLLTNNTEAVQKAVTELINKAVLFITDNLPKILEIAILLVVTLAKGISESSKNIIPAIMQCLITIIQTFLENVGLIIDTAIQLVIALVDALLDPKTLDLLIDSVPIILESFIDAVVDNMPKLLTLGPLIILKLISAIISNLPKLLEKAPEIIITIITGMIKSLGMFVEVGKQILDSVYNAVKDIPKNAVSWGKDIITGFVSGITKNLYKITDAVSGVAQKIKSFLHFSRPDEGPLREYETWMPDFINGLAKSMRNSSGILEDATLDLADDMSSSLLKNTSMALRGLNAGIQASLNPTINPTYSYDLNYQLMSSAMKEALEEVGVYLDDRKVGQLIDKKVSEEVYS